MRRTILRSLVALTVLVATTALFGLVVGLHSIALAGAELAAIVAMVVGYRKIDANLERRIRGIRGEQHVGAILDGLASVGWKALHDCSPGRGNVDHVVVGPGGIFTVETKSHGGRVDVSTLDARWLKQAYAQRKAIEEVIGEHVECLLVFSRAYLSAPVSRRRGVTVLPARMLAAHLARCKVVYSAEQVEAMYDRLGAALISRAAGSAHRKSGVS